MTIETLIARVGVVAEASPFVLTETDDPFSFDQQPQTAMDGCYRVEAELERQEGYLGMACLETWAVTLWTAKRAGRSPGSVRDGLTVAVSSLTAALHRDALVSCDYDVVEVSGDVQYPDGEAEYLVGRVRAQVEFDRSL
jgi:hypothetical protein